MDTVFTTLPAELHRCIAEYLSMRDRQVLTHTCVVLRSAYASSFANCFLVSEDSYTNLDPAYRCIPVHVFLKPQIYSWFKTAQVRTIAVTGLPPEDLISALNTGAMGLFAVPGGAAAGNHNDLRYPQLCKIVLDLPMRRRPGNSDRQVRILLDDVSDMVIALAANLPPHIELDLRMSAREILDRLKWRSGITRLLLRLIMGPDAPMVLDGFSGLTCLHVKPPARYSCEHYRGMLTSIATLPSLKRLSVIYYACDYFKLQSLLVLPDTLEECKLELDLNFATISAPTTFNELVLPQITHITIESEEPLDSLLMRLAKLRLPRLQCVQGCLDPATWLYWLAGSRWPRQDARFTGFQHRLPDITSLDLTNSCAFDTAPQVATAVLLIGNLSCLRELTICPFRSRLKDMVYSCALYMKQDVDNATQLLKNAVSFSPEVYSNQSINEVTQFFTDLVAFLRALPDNFHQTIPHTLDDILCAIYDGIAATAPENVADVRALLDSLYRENHHGESVAPCYRTAFPMEYAAAQAALPSMTNLSLFFDLLMRPEMVVRQSENFLTKFYQHLPYLEKNSTVSVVQEKFQNVATNELLMKTVVQRLKDLRVLRLVNCPSIAHAFWFRAAVTQPNSALAKIVLLTAQDDDFLCAHNIVPANVPAFLQPYTSAPVAVPASMSLNEFRQLTIFPRATVIDLVALRHGVPDSVVRGSGEAKGSTYAVFSAGCNDVEITQAGGDRPVNQMTSCYFSND